MSHLQATGLAVQLGKTQTNFEFNQHKDHHWGKSVVGYKDNVIIPTNMAVWSGHPRGPVDIVRGKIISSTMPQGFCLSILQQGLPRNRLDGRNKTLGSSSQPGVDRDNRQKAGWQYLLQDLGL